MAQSLIPFSGGNLRLIETSDYRFIEALFSDPEVRKYYVLREDHAQNLYSFTVFMTQAISNGTGINYIIEDNTGKEVGLISSELIRFQGEIMWNIGYAVLPAYRRMGYASKALTCFTDFLLNNSPIQWASLDISETNTASEKVAAKCGFQKPAGGPNVGYIDPKNFLDIGFHFKWLKQQSGRIAIFNQAMQYARAKDYSTAIDYYRKALSEPYDNGTPYTDAQIYSNIGMCYSSIGQYKTAYDCLMRAKRMGLTNASIEKELLWLKNNVGLG